MKLNYDKHSNYKLNPNTEYHHEQQNHQVHNQFHPSYQIRLNYTLQATRSSRSRLTPPMLIEDSLIPNLLELSP